MLHVQVDPREVNTVLNIVAKWVDFPLESFKADRKLLPNKLSFARIILSPLPAALLVLGAESTMVRLLATVIFVVVAASDGIDGYIARKYNMTSDLGRWLDPVGDKLLVVTTYLALVVVSLGAPNSESLYWLFWLSLLREVTLAVAIHVVQRQILSPTPMGKLKMALQCLAAGVWLLPMLWPWLVTVRDWVTWVTIAVVVYSWAEYAVKFVFRGRLSV